ncbi:LytR/AlgR family response regulator transcription factor [Bacteroidota bacterium]
MKNRFRTLIVDDEKPARDLIIHYLGSYENFEIVGEAGNGFEAFKLIQENKPDLVFLDIQMPKVSGLELFELLDKPYPDVIFSTAYDQYAIDAFELNALDYLLKPFDKTRFEKAIDKFLYKRKGNVNISGKQQSDIVIHAFPQEIEKVVVKSGYKIYIIPVEEIYFIEAQNDYVKVHSQGGKYLKQQTMKFFEDRMPAEKFVRIHRSYIINLDELARIEIVDKNNSLALMKTGDKLAISKRGIDTLKKHLDF